MYEYATGYIRSSMPRAPNGMARRGSVAGIEDGIVVDLQAGKPGDDRQPAQASIDVNIRRAEHPMQSLLTLFGVRGVDPLPDRPGWHTVPTPLPIKLELARLDDQLGMRWYERRDVKGSAQPIRVGKWYFEWKQVMGTGVGMARKDGSGTDWEIRAHGSVFERAVDWEAKRRVNEVQVPMRWMEEVRQLRRG